MKVNTTEDGWNILADEDVAATLQKPEYYFRKGCEVVRYRSRVVYRLEEENGSVLAQTAFPRPPRQARI